MEMAAHNITVNAYAPGIVGTAMWDLIDEELGKLKGAKKGDTIKKYTDDLIALGRTSVPEDVSSTVSWLAGKDSNYGMQHFPLCSRWLLANHVLDSSDWTDDRC